MMPRVSFATVVMWPNNSANRSKYFAARTSYETSSHNAGYVQVSIALLERATFYLLFCQLNKGLVKTI